MVDDLDPKSSKRARRSRFSRGRGLYHMMWGTPDPKLWPVSDEGRDEEEDRESAVSEESNAEKPESRQGRREKSARLPARNKETSGGTHPVT